ncbi:MAG: branched-chain amino acid ABC transporter permease [bacterium]|jgi:branched-chain amino acid transport system permease protein
MLIQEMITFFQQLLNGLTLGSTYALIALGYTMVYGILEIINFAHGEIYMFGAFVGMFLIRSGVPFILAFLMAMAASALLGITIERIAYRPLRTSPRITALISAIGMSILLQNLAILLLGPQTQAFPKPFAVSVFKIAELPGYPNALTVQINSLQIFIMLISCSLMLGLHFLVQKTKIGKAMRATAQDKETSSLMGINVNNVISVTFAIGSSLGAAAGILIGIYFNAVYPTMGAMPGLKGFVAAVMGGIGNIPGAMVGGMLLGLMEVFGAAYISSSLKDAIAFSVLIIILLLRPAGLLGKNVQEKV